MIYLDNASTSWPKPECVYEVMSGFLREKGGNPGRGGHSMSQAAWQVMEETRVLLARLINAPEKDRVIFTFNCTDSLNLGLKGVLKPGDEVITSRIEHNSLLRPLKKLEGQGVRITRLPPCSEDGFLSPRDIERAMSKRTKLVAITHASNVTGVIQPIEEYGAVVRKYNSLFMVDAAQTAGSLPIDVQSSNIDLLAFSGHKALLGPPGTGVLYVGDRVELDSLREGGTGSHSEQEEQPLELPFRYECGTPNTVGIAGLREGLKYIFQEGMENIRSHEQSLLRQLLEGLSQIPGVILYKPEDISRQASIVSFNIKGWDPAEVGVILDQNFDIKVRSGLHCSAAAHKTFGTFPKGTIRISPGYFNTAQEIDFVLQSLRKMVNLNH